MLPVTAAPIRHGAVLLQGERIVAVAPAAELIAAHTGPVEDLGDDALIAPGFIDAHCHLEWSAFAGVISSRPFAEWLTTFFPLRRRMTEADHEAAALAGARAAAIAGTTTVGDSGPTGAGVDALTRVGLRGLVHLEAFGAPTADAAAQEAAQAAARVTALAESAAASPRVRVGLSPHAPYTVGPELWRALAATGDLGALPWMTHIAESPAEVRALTRDDGPLATLFDGVGVTRGRWPHPEPDASVVARMERAGAFGGRLVAAHCVQLAAEDPQRLAAGAVAVAHCPRSNVHLHCGAAPLTALRAAGVRVALGTDSPASGGDFDLRAEARACAALHGAAAPTADELLQLITRAGAEVLGLERRVGALEPGLEADLVVLRAARAEWGAEPAATALAATTTVERTLVAGRPVATSGRTVALDDEAVIAAVAAIGERLR